MVKMINKNILIVSRHLNRQGDDLQCEINSIEKTLLGIDQPEKLSTCVEIFDMNRYRIVRKSNMVNRLLRGNMLRQFVFVFNMN